MSGIERLHLEDALEDSPQTRSLLGVFEKDAMELRNYASALNQCCQRVLDAQMELCSATQSLSSQLKVYGAYNFPLESEDSILTSTLKQFASYMDEISSLQQIIATQLSDGMMYPIGRFLQADLDEIHNMREMIKLASTEHESSVSRYMKLGRRKDGDKTKQEANEDLYSMRRKLHQSSLHYYSALNSLQYKRKCSLLEPFLGYIQAQKAFFSMGRESLEKPEIDNFLSNINASIQDVQRELNDETTKTVEKIKDIEQGCVHLYYGEPPPEMPYMPPNDSLAQKGGYLFLRSKQALITTKWERCYFFTQAGNLMCQHKDEVAGSLILDLNEDGTHAELTDCDDRRNVFQVVSPSNKKTVILQAENERERDEWVFTIMNIVKKSGYVKGQPELDLKAASPAIAVPKVNEPQRNGKSGSVPPPTPPSTPAESGFIPDAPIQFDIISPSEESKPFRRESKEGPQKRINPFDQSKVGIVNDNTDNAAFYETFEVRFLGSMEVRTDRGEELICETIRQIMAARALHNIFRTTESLLVVSSDATRLIDPSNNSVRCQFDLSDISYWASHQENKRLFGIITRTRPAQTGSKATYVCHVFECNSSAEEICHAISTATKLAFQALMEKKTQEKERSAEQQVLMDNIGKLDDADATGTPQLSADGSGEKPS